MANETLDVPGELIELLAKSKLAGRPPAIQVRVALAIHLFLEAVVSIGKAAELAGVPRVEFEWLLVEMGIPTVRYELSDYQQDLRGIADAQQRRDTA